MGEKEKVSFVLEDTRVYHIESIHLTPNPEKSEGPHRVKEFKESVIPSFLESL